MAEMSEQDKLYAVELELEIRRRMEELAKVPGKTEEPSTAFKVGSAIRSAIPEDFRKQASSVGNVVRQFPEFGALIADLAKSPFTAIDRALGADSEYFPSFRAVNEAGNVAFGAPNPLEKILGAAWLGGTTGLMTKAIGPVRGTAAGGMGYVGAEGGGALGKGVGSGVGEKLGVDKKTSEAVGETAGTLIGGTLFGIPTALPGINTANRLAAEGLKGFSPSKRLQMIALQDDMNKAGIFSLPSQLDEIRPQNLLALERQTLGANVGKGSLEGKIESILPSARKFARGSGQALGQVDDSLSRANAVQDVIERVIDAPRQRAREAAKPFYEMLRLDRPQLPVDVRFSIANKMADLNDQVGLLERSFAGRATSKVEKTIARDSPILSAAKGNPPFRLAEGGIYEMDNYLKELRTRIEKLSGLNADAKTAVEKAGLRPAFQEIRSTLVEQSDVLKAGKQAYERTRNQGAEAVRSTGIPAAKPLNLQPGPLTPAAKWKQFETIFDQGNQADVRRAAAMMRSKDNEAFRDVAKNWIKRNVDETLLPGSGNQAEPKVLAEKMLSHPNLDAILEEAAKGVKGVEPTEFALGFKKAMRILQAAGRVPQQASGVDVSHAIKADPIAVAGRFGVVHELGKKAMLASKYFEWAQNRQWKKLYSAFDSEDSMRQLANMASMAEMNPRTASYLSTLVGGTVSVD